MDVHDRTSASTDQVEERAPNPPGSSRHGGAAHTVRFRILGSLEVERGGQPIPLGAPQQRVVLGLLLVRANELVPFDALVDELWGDDPPEAARNTIYTYVSHLRKVVGADRIQSQAPGYRFVLDPSELDAARFERLLKDASSARIIDPGIAATVLEEAIGLWRGHALSDVAERGTLLAEATRLDELRLAAGEERLEALLSTGDHARVIVEAEALLDRAPLRERVWGQLMLALYREGRQAEALGAFQRVREVLADELGIDPSRQLTTLHEQILRQDPALELRGEPLRGYRLLERIGDGATGAVFRSVQPRVGRDVAVKSFHEQIASDPSFVRRFEREAQAAASLEHPHIAPVYDYWREPGGAYIVSRYLKGGSLRALEARGDRTDLDRGLLIVEQIAGALAFAHRQGIAHGRVSASNVLFDGEQNAYLADFHVGIGEPPDPADDVRGLGSLAHDLLGDRMPPSLAELVEGVRLGADPPAAAAFAAGARAPAGSAPAHATRSDDARNPYKGLRAFTEADALDFYGRNELIARMIDRLTATGRGSRFLAVVGPSGSGKSSLVRAGLVPAIRRGDLGDPRSIFVVDMFPGAHPLEELEASLVRAASRRAPRLRDVLERGSRGLLEAVDALLPSSAELVLVVDQFEEVFTLTSDEHERALFLESIRVAAADADSRIRVVITLRADFYDRPLIYPRFGELLASTTEAVPPLTPDELEQAIRRPAEGVGITLEPGLVAEMVADVADQPGALPLLQYALTEVFEHREGDRLTLGPYRSLGGVGGALGVRADRIFDGMAIDAQRAARQVFLRLVHLGEGRQDTRRRVPRRELDELDQDPRTVRSVLDTYGRHRLLTFDREPATREPTAEIAHEALLTAWARLRRWIDDAREDLRHESRLARAAGEWRASAHDPSFLLRGARLDQIEVWASSTDLAIGRSERAYLKAGVDQRQRELEAERARRDREALTERRSRLRLRALVAVLSVAALVASGLVVLATDQGRRAGREASRAERAATIATARELAAAAVTNLDVDPERSILLAMEAVSLTRSLDGSVLPEAEDALHRAVAVSRVTMTVEDVGGSVAWGSAGVFAAEAAREPGLVVILDDRTGDRLLSIPAHEGDVTGIAFGPDGTTLATSGTDGALRVWDPSTGELLAEGVGAGTTVGLMGNASGSFIALWPDQEVVRIVDPASHQVRSLSVPARPLLAASSPDGGRLAVMAGRGRSFELIVLDIVTGKTLSSSRRWGSAIAWSPDGRSIALPTSDPSVVVIDAATGERRFDVGGHQGFVTDVSWSSDASFFVSSALDGTVKVWDVGSDEAEERLSLSSAETLNGIGGIALAPEGDRVMVGAQDATAVKVWDLRPRGNAELANLPASGNLGDVEFLPDGALAATDPTTATGTTATIWNLQTDRALRLGSVPNRWTGHGLEVAVSPDGTSIASMEYHKSLEVLDLEDGSELFTYASPKVTDVEWSPDGDLLLISRVDGSAVIVDRSGTEVQTLADPRFRIRVARFSPDGTSIAASGIAPSGPSVWVWDRQRSQVVGRIPASAERFAFDPSGARIATVPPSGGQPEVWDLGTGERLTVLSGSSGYVWDVAFSPDGSRIATAAFDGTGVRMFDAASGTQLFTLPGLHGAWRLDFAPDGSMLAAITSGEIRVWALDIDDLLEIARENVTRPLTDEECRQYLHLETCPAQPAPWGSPSVSGD